MIGEHGENFGVMPLEKALALARPADGLDLIEIAPKAKPPVARLMSFDKYRYERGKAEKKERASQKTAEMKRVQISARAAENDLKIKAHKTEKFLSEDRPVEVYMRLRGREKYNKPWASHRLEEFLKMIAVEYKMVGIPKFGGNNLSVTIINKTK